MPRRYRRLKRRIGFRHVCRVLSELPDPGQRFALRFHGIDAQGVSHFPGGGFVQGSGLSPPARARRRMYFLHHIAPLYANQWRGRGPGSQLRMLSIHMMVRFQFRHASVEEVESLLRQARKQKQKVSLSSPGAQAPEEDLQRRNGQALTPGEDCRSPDHYRVGLCHHGRDPVLYPPGLVDLTGLVV